MNGVTIPPDVAMTAQKPDLVIINRKSKEVKLVELTVPGNNFQHVRCSPEEDREVREPGHRDQGQWLQVLLEIGTRGIVNTRSRAVLAQLCQGLKVNKVSCVTKNCSKLAFLGSYTIWNA